MNQQERELRTRKKRCWRGSWNNLGKVQSKARKKNVVRKNSNQRVEVGGVKEV